MKTQSINPKTAARSIRKSPIPETTGRGFLLMPLLFVCFALLPAPNVAQLLPAPDGGYPNWNTAEGTNALFNLTTGSYNTALGGLALHSVADGGYNTAVGFKALFHNTANNNTALGEEALYFNSTGGLNTALGEQALYFNTTGNFNTASGNFALYNNTTGHSNTATGYSALALNATGDSNTALGQNAGLNITGSGNVCIGAGVTGVAGENDTTRIRNIYASVANGRAVYVNSDNKVGTLSSSRRYKDEIRPMAKASEAILSLRPVSFRYNKEVDPTRSLSFGLIAEEVAQVDPDLVTPDRYGRPETVRYEAVNAMLLNEFLKEHKRVEEQQATIAELESTASKQQATITELKSTVSKQEATIAELERGFQSNLATQEKEIRALTSGLEIVNAKLEVSGLAPRTVATK